MSGKVALVTGGARRIGAAICGKLHESGFDVLIHYRESEREAMALRDKLLVVRPGSAEVVQADLLDIDSLPGLVDAAIRLFGRLDVLVNNASSFYPTPVGKINSENWDDLIGTNLRAPVFLAQAAADVLKAGSGCIVNIADIHAERPMKNHLVYSVGKAGLIAATRSLARELGPDIRVNAIAPGAILWPEDGRYLTDEVRRCVVANTLLKREGAPEDVAAAVKYLAADALYVTGQVLVVDGGREVMIVD